MRKSIWRSISIRSKSTDEAKAHLNKLIAGNPSDLEAIMALGNVMRGRKQFAECADVIAKGDRYDHQEREVELGDLLFPRYLL